MEHELTKYRSRFKCKDCGSYKFAINTNDKVVWDSKNVVINNSIKIKSVECQDCGKKKKVKSKRKDKSVPALMDRFIQQFMIDYEDSICMKL